MALIQLSNIVKSYPDGENKRNNVLRGISFDVQAGDFIAITGASGSGKTTLLSILGTLLQPDSGSYFLSGEEMFAAGVDLSVVRNKNIGFVFQEHRLMPQYTVLDNILLPVLAQQSKAEKEQIEYAWQLMDITGITSIANQYPQTISGGEASRTALCRSLIMKPLLLLADEPTGQLDNVNSRNIVSLLSQINKELGTTIVMVTHSEEVSAAANNILSIKDGVLL
jgi:ABC-type antimicrobial peptide transport system, ATPase component